jgi:hypothetical protein
MTAWYLHMRSREELFLADLRKHTCWEDIDDVLTINKRYNPSVYWHLDKSKLFLARQLDKLFRANNLPNRVWPSLPETRNEERVEAFQQALTVIDIAERMYDLGLWTEARVRDNMALATRYLIINKKRRTNNGKARLSRICRC